MELSLIVAEKNGTIESQSKTEYLSRLRSNNGLKSVFNEVTLLSRDIFIKIYELLRQVFFQLPPKLSSDTTYSLNYAHALYYDEV